MATATKKRGRGRPATVIPYNKKRSIMARFKRGEKRGKVAKEMSLPFTAVNRMYQEYKDDGDG